MSQAWLVLHTLPAPFFTSSTPLMPITQGAEALLFKTSLITTDTPAALKYRPPKPYRHPILDKKLTKQRILAEARVLVKCAREGVPVPRVLAVGWEEGWVGVEWIRGGTLRGALNEWESKRMGTYIGKSAHEDGGEEAEEAEEAVKDLMSRIGIAVGRLHQAGVVHGDLTTSNIMLRPTTQSPSGESQEHEQSNGSLKDEVVLIDFGLAAQSVQDEDRAVDLYVLERAFGATHPKAEPFFGDLLRAYGDSFKGAKVVVKRLEEVRLRGRKKSMIG
ncbi:kinase-like protein [Patellaria atrata CBS 101060]|uniref:EKC/KEOPS complex subunit BUD32 n=1 Tax=Patellaria atrata CBS 101060 TaxID=1346257 RepID=A0A9P4VP40_9PEZI|nr:kinase-like protein [Patellaria atrata CBS 101060]